MLPGSCAGKSDARMLPLRPLRTRLGPIPDPTCLRKGTRDIAKSACPAVPDQMAPQTPRRSTAGPRQRRSRDWVATREASA
jgi:hypothetical protein